MLLLLPSRLAIGCIAAYQKFVSPRKGWSCAHRVRHGGLSCSEFVRRAVAERGLGAAVPLARARFAECSEAGKYLRGPGPSGRGRRRRRRGRDDGSACDIADDFCGCGDKIFSCGPGDSGCIDCSP